ncbi:serine/threonine-protein kinase MARK2-like [Saccopteryx bilineata]|uniref:serine/threonine-protein kinase MARK2-like n=1 Tax=Saccopteryx bilineata TaxID=59482 RepID=UPI00338E0896
MLGDYGAIPWWMTGDVGNYLFVRTLGTGGFGTVKLARHVLTGIYVAVKIVSLKDCPNAFREVEFLKALNHPNVVKLVEVIVRDFKLYMVMEYVSGGDLFDYLPRDRPSTEAEARRIFRQLLSALQYCHRLNIVHRDLKLENVLVDADKNIRITDFGLGRKVQRDELKTYCGTVNCMAPEMLLEQTYEGRKVDIWGLGVILFHMVTGHSPFRGQNLTKVKRDIMTGNFRIPGYLSVECRALLKNLMALNPSERSAADELFQHPWVINGQKEQLEPYGDVPRGNLDPEIVAEMNRIGFQHPQVSVEEDSASISGEGMSNPESRASTPPSGPASWASTPPSSPKSWLSAPPPSPKSRPQVLAQHSTIQSQVPGQRSTIQPQVPGQSSTIRPSPLCRRSTIRPSLPGGRSTIRPSLPGGRSTIRPSLPGRRSTIRPSLPGWRSTIRPSLPGRSSTIRPSLPGWHSTIRPSLPGRRSTIRPSLPGRRSTIRPCLPGRRSTIRPSLPGRRFTIHPSLSGRRSTIYPSLSGRHSTIHP